MIAAVLDHLWQSTLFAGGAGLVTLLLQGNAARVRFWIWFIASIKFLVPFSVLATLGAWLLPQSAEPLPMLEGLAPEAGPFVVPVARVQAWTAAMPQLTSFNWTGLIFAVWGAGVLAVAFHWLSRWHRMRAALAQASDLTLTHGFVVRSSPTSLEPGLFGIWDPVIVLPQNISEKLSGAELEAVLMHEHCHMRYRDNLLAAVHMLVEMLFWFHPLVWWLGGRLNHERERACDEAVLASGQAPAVYAESILKVCKLYLCSPLPCVSGVSGADLKQRIERIVVNGVALPLGRLHKLLLAGLAASSLIAPLSISLLMAPRIVEALPQAKPVILDEHIAQLRSEQAAPRKVVAFDPKNFDKFVGYYQFGPNSVMTVTREGTRYLTRLTGQQNVAVYPESQTKLFATVVAAQISFDSDASGHTIQLVLHQNGFEQVAPRISADEALRLEATLASRVRSKTPSPGTEASLRRYIDSLEKGSPNYEEMAPGLAQTVHQQLPGILQYIRQCGPLESITFERVGPNGMDEYDVVFERGRADWFVGALAPDGKVYERGFQPRT